MELDAVAWLRIVVLTAVVLGALARALGWLPSDILNRPGKTERNAKRPAVSGNRLRALIIVFSIAVGIGLSAAVGR